MRINKFIALATGVSRRAADALIAEGRVTVNGQLAPPATQVTDTDTILLDDQTLQRPETLQVVLLHKPAGYVVSRDGQGSRTVYDLLPPTLHSLKPVGRLDKDSSGLLLLTNDGALAQELTHPSRQKLKQYEVALDHPLQPLHRQMIADIGITLDDGRSQLGLERLREDDDHQWIITMREGRNRQIRRTFAALGYGVTRLHRTHFGAYTLPSNLSPGAFQSVSESQI